MEDYNQIIDFLKTKYTPYQLIMDYVRSEFERNRKHLEKLYNTLRKSKLTPSDRVRVMNEIDKVEDELAGYRETYKEYTNKDFSEHKDYKSIQNTVAIVEKFTALFNKIEQYNANTDATSVVNDMEEFLTLVGADDDEKRLLTEISDENFNITRTVIEQKAYLQETLKKHINNKLETALNEAFLSFERTLSSTVELLRKIHPFSISERVLTSILRKQGLNTENDLVIAAIKRSKNRLRNTPRETSKRVDDHLSVVTGLIQHFNQPYQEHTINDEKDINEHLKNLKRELAQKKRTLDGEISAHTFHDTCIRYRTSIRIKNKTLEELELLIQAKTSLIDKTEKLETTLNDINISDEAKQYLTNLSDKIKNEKGTYVVTEIHDLLNELNNSLADCSLTSQQRQTIDTHIEHIENQLKKCTIGQKLTEEISELDALCKRNNLAKVPYSILHDTLEKIKETLASNKSVERKKTLIKGYMKELQDHCNLILGSNNDKSKALRKELAHFSEYLEGLSCFNQDKSLDELKELVKLDKENSEKSYNNYIEYYLRCKYEIKNLDSKITTLKSIAENYQYYKGSLSNSEKPYAENDYLRNPRLVADHLSIPNAKSETLRNILNELNIKYDAFVDKYHNDRYKNSNEVFRDIADILSDATVVLLEIKPNMNARELKAYLTRFGTDSDINVGDLLTQAREKKKLRDKTLKSTRGTTESTSKSPSRSMR